jgi:hypothetical protein
MSRSFIYPLFCTVLLSLVIHPRVLSEASTEPACTFPSAFERHPENPVKSKSGLPFHEWGIVSDPFVMAHDGRYRIWFTSANWSVPPWLGGEAALGTAYAESDTGLIWDDQWLRPDKSGELINLVLEPENWDSHGIETVTVTQDEEGTWMLYYSGNQKPDGLTHAIGLATSSDGIVLQRYGDKPILEPELDWEEPVCVDFPACNTYFGGVLEPTVVRDDLYRLWYAAWGVHDEQFGYRMGYATSEDGYNWMRHSEPVFEGDENIQWERAIVSHFHVTPDPVVGYHLFYFGSSPSQDCGDCNMTPGAIGHAYSPDGIHWSRNPNNPIIPWTVYGGPSAIIEGNEIKLWYFTSLSEEDANQFQFDIELAIGTCG